VITFARPLTRRPRHGRAVMRPNGSREEVDTAGAHTKNYVEDRPPNAAETQG
jgi:hypothetical protein